MVLDNFSSMVLHSNEEQIFVQYSYLKEFSTNPLCSFSVLNLLQMLREIFWYMGFEIFDKIFNKEQGCALYIASYIS